MRKCGPVALRFRRRECDCSKQRTMSATSQRIALSLSVSAPQAGTAVHFLHRQLSFRISVVIEVSLDNAASFPYSLNYEKIRCRHGLGRSSSR